MAWAEKTVNSWDEFKRIMDVVLEGGPRLLPRILFRGQADAAWRLSPSLLRIPGTEKTERALHLEKLARRSRGDEQHEDRSSTR
jgi:hypothetical protein